MVKFDVADLRFMEEDDFRVLIGLELALRNHDVAPTVLIERIAGLPHGGARRRLNMLLKNKLIHHESRPYDGYALKYQAYDYLAMRTFCKRGTVTAVGSRVGCGKESDIILVQDENGNEVIMKLQRLGRCSFRSVARNRDYKGNMKERRGASWFYLSRLAAQKEFAFMKLLHDEGFPVPKPIDQNRHAIVMEHVNSKLLNNIETLGEKNCMAQKVYERCLALIVRLGQNGLVHGDFNEFNLFVNDDYNVIMIDFPQMVSIDHHNASELFDRDIQNLALFFERKFGLKQAYFPRLEVDVERSATLDRALMASGAISKQQLKDMDQLMEENDDVDGEDEEDGEGDGDGDGEEGEEDDDGDDDTGSDEDGAEHDDDDDDDNNDSDRERAALEAAALAADPTLSKRDLRRRVAVAVAEAAVVKKMAAAAARKNMASAAAAVVGTITASATAAATTATTATTAKASTSTFTSLAAFAKGQDLEAQLGAAAAAAVTDSAINNNNNINGGDDDDDGRRSVAPSVATTIAPQKLSAEQIRERVKRQLSGRDEAEFRRNMHRNCMKGKEQIRVKRMIKNQAGTDASGIW